MKSLAYKKITIVSLLALLLMFLAGAYIDLNQGVSKVKTDVTKTTTARVVANGDILIHDILYMSARQSDGTYDFKPYFEYVKDWICHYRSQYRHSRRCPEITGNHRRPFS